MRVVLDGMGGDYAPKEIVKGAVEATEYINDEIVIVGPEEEILEELKACKYKGTQIEVIDAPDMITMEDSPVKAIRRKPNSSLVSPPGSSVHGILQVRILKWVAIPFSRGSSRPRGPCAIQTHVIQGSAALSSHSGQALGWVLWR